MYYFLIGLFRASFDMVLVELQQELDIGKTSESIETLCENTGRKQIEYALRGWPASLRVFNANINPSALTKCDHEQVPRSRPWRILYCGQEKYGDHSEDGPHC